jgi:hypothetical protein
MKNEVQIKEFLGVEVRVVNDEYIVLKDMFGALGRLSKDGQIESKERLKLSRFLTDINKESARETFLIALKGKKKSREMQEIDCLKLDTVPIVLTQFRPTERKGLDSLNKWKEFMKFVDGLLTSLEVHKFIVTDKEHQKSNMETIIDCGGSTTITNQQVNGIMAELIGVYNQGIKRINKDELKKYESQTTVDLLQVREYVLEKFTNAYEFTGSHKTARTMATKLAKKKYNLHKEDNNIISINNDSIKNKAV